MVKETETTATKKRKPDATDTVNGTVDPKSAKIDVEEKKPSSVSIYQQVTAFEEKEAAERDPAKDLVQYKGLCEEFAEHICKVSGLMTSKPEGWAEEVKEKKIEVGLLTVFMKKLNRVEKIRNRNARENVTKVRQQVDVLQLQLQNLMCEIQHLNREVDKCLLFKSKPLGVDLVPVEEFYKSAPETITRPDVTKNDEHQLLLARLEWELQQRKELSAACSQLEGKKKSLTSQINKKTADLESLAPLIKDILTSTKPLQDKLGYNAGPSIAGDRPSLLPHCLYFLYIQAAAYKEASDDAIMIEIVGDDEAAKELMKQRAYSGDREPKSSDEESENEDSEKTSKKELQEKVEKRRKKLLEKHPLSVTIKLIFKDESSLSLEFYYMLRLNVMSVVPTLSLKNTHLKGTDALESLYGRDILANLFVGDDGSVSPNVSNYYQLDEVGLEAIDTKKLGLPYAWVQKIGGLDFSSAAPSESPSGIAVLPRLELAKTTIPTVLKAIRRRVHARIILAKQVAALENKTVVGPPVMRSVKVSCSLKSWKSITWEEFRDHPASAYMRTNDSVSPQDLFFCATVVRGRAKMTVLVVAVSNYPVDPPKFCLQIELNDLVLNTGNSKKVQDMEKEVNLYWREMTDLPAWTSTLLLHQIHRAMVVFDIFLECTDPSKFSAEKKTFLHPHSGRTRAHPYKYAAVGEGVFLRR